MADPVVLKRTKIMEKTGLVFPLSSFKSWIIKTFESNGHNLPKFKGFHVAMTTVAEVYTRMLLEEAAKGSVKDTSGLYHITTQSVLNAAVYHDEYKHLFKPSFDYYDPNTNYADLLCIPKKIMVEYINNVLGHNIMFEQSAYSLFAFFLYRTLASYVFHCGAMCEGMKLKSASFRTAMCIVKMKCNRLPIEKALITRLENVERLYNEKTDEEKTTAAPAAPAAKTKHEKPGDKEDKGEESADDESDDEDKEEDKEESDEEESDEDDEEEEPPPKVVPKKAPPKQQAKPPVKQQKKTKAK